jgi:hypothetical protein
VKQMTKQQINSYDPVAFNDWVIKVSKDRTTQCHCVVMMHRFEHVLEIAYVNNEEEANDFITNILERGN